MTLTVVRLVVDASLAAKWVVEEGDLWQAVTLLTVWQEAGARPVFPAWGVAEVSNLLLQHVRRGTLSLIDAQDNLIELVRVVDLVPHDPRLSRRALGIAHQLSLGATYDAHYLALAERLGCELWTADEQLRRTATANALFPNVRALSDYGVAGPNETVV